MKHALILKTLFLFLAWTAAKAGNPDSTVAAPTYGAAGKYKVRLMRNNDVVDSLVVEKNRPFCFFLRKDEQYRINISCEGYSSRTMQVNTTFPGRKPNQSYFKFLVNTELPSGNAALPADASIAFDEHTRSFYYGD